MNRNLLLLFAFALTHCFVVCVAGQTVAARYRFDSWTTENGLPHNSIQAIRQTRDGYLWLATMDGLVRFDGLNFRTFNKVNTAAINDNRFAVFALYEDSRGTLWAGTVSGGAIRYANGEFTVFTTKDGLPGNHVIRIDEDDAGCIWIYTEGGLAKYQNGRLEKVAPVDDSQLNGYLNAPSNVGVDGFLFGLWRRDASGWQRFAFGKWTNFPLPPQISDASKLQIASIVEDSKGRIWYNTINVLHEYYLVEGERLTVYRNLPSGYFVCYADSDGNLWMANHDGQTGVWRNGKFEIMTDIATPSIFRALEDREGGFWLGTREAGLFRRRTQTIKTLRNVSSSEFNKIGAMMQDKSGKVWLGSGGLQTYADNRFERLYGDSFVSKNYNFGDVYSFYEDRDGSIIVGAWNGVARYANGKLQKDEQISAITKNILRATLRDDSGALWLGYSDGLYRQDANGAVTHFTTKNGLPSNGVTVLRIDRKGALWIGTDNGLARFDGEQFETITELGDLKSNLITQIYEDADGVLWVGTRDNGLHRINCSFGAVRATRYTTEQGLYSNNIFQILEDDKGFLWISCHRGIFRINRGELNDLAENKIRAVRSNYFGKADGMLDATCSGGVQNAGFKTHDGKLWFATQNGVAMIDPADVKFNNAVPPVVFEESFLDQSPIDLSSDLKVQPSQENLQINFTALSLVKSEQIRFRYKLENLDGDWTEAGTRRTVNYSHLPSGEYVFRVIADNGDGVWNKEGASLRIKVLPPFYRTLWFIAICILSVFGATVCVYKIRINQVERRRAAQEDFSRRLINAHEAERRRVAAELHDSIGQTLAMIKNRAVFGSQATDDEAAQEQLAAITTQTTQAIGEVREISYNLRPYLLERLGLTKAIKSLVNKIEEVHLLTIEARIDDVDDLFAGEAQMSVYRIIQESLNNVAKHAETNRAQLTIIKSSEFVTIAIEDYGRGFDKHAPPKTDAKNGGFGLLGINERVRMLGGTLEIQTAIDKGTKLTIKIQTKR